MFHVHYRLLRALLVEDRLRGIDIGEEEIETALDQAGWE